MLSKNLSESCTVGQMVRLLTLLDSSTLDKSEHENNVSES